jgi:hypothetical protein
MSACFFCGKAFPENFKVYKTSECPSCGKDVKVCLNCRFYSPGSKWDCKETIPEAVRDKEKANFCEYFRLGGTASDGSLQEKSKKARSEFNSLFSDE